MMRSKESKKKSTNVEDFINTINEYDSGDIVGFKAKSAQVVGGYQTHVPSIIAYESSQQATYNSAGICTYKRYVIVQFMRNYHISVAFVQKLGEFCEAYDMCLYFINFNSSSIGFVEGGC